MKIAVLGSRGKLGSAVVQGFRPHHDVTPFDRASLDITDPAAVSAALSTIWRHCDAEMEDVLKSGTFSIRNRRVK